MPNNKNRKLAYKYFEPFKILKNMGLVAYQLELPKDVCIHSTFHVSLLKKWVGKNTTLELWLLEMEPRQPPQPLPMEVA